MNAIHVAVRAVESGMTDHIGLRALPHGEGGRMKRPFAYIAGTGHAVPKQIVTNARLRGDGPRHRRRSGSSSAPASGSATSPREGESLTSLAADAARQAMAKRRCHSRARSTSIVLGTASPDHLLPATAVEVQTALGCTRAAAFDIARRVLAAGCTAPSSASRSLPAAAPTRCSSSAPRSSARIVDWTDRNTCILFADGAGAAVLRRTRGGQKGILSSFMRSDGALAELLWRPAGGGVEPFSPDVFEEKRQYVHMAGREVFKHAVRSMAEATDRALDAARLTAADIDLLIPHQANIRIIEATAKHAGLSMDRCSSTSTGSATRPRRRSRLHSTTRSSRDASRKE